MSVTVLDGGMGRELIRRGVAKRQGLWSAAALLDAPQIVVETHRDFIAAGARVITTNTYSCVPSYLAKAGLAERFADLAGLAGQLARQAASDSGERVLVAGSLPPLSESYRPDMVIADEQAGPIYHDIAEVLAPAVDLFLCETMSSIRESMNAAQAALAAGSRRGLPVWVSWTLGEEPGTGLRSGESVTEAYRALETLDVQGFFFNCTHPSAIEAAVEEISQLTDRPTGGYPNRFDVPSGWTLDNELFVRPREGFGTDKFVHFARRLVERGASLVGGCCAVGPEDIAAMAAWLKQRGAATAVGSI